MWEEITPEEFMQLQRGRNYKPVASFSDPDGSCQFGYRCPAMDTEYGYDSDSPALRLEMRKASQEEIVWTYSYFKNPSHPDCK